jgi:hypothetical protein
MIGRRAEKLIHQETIDIPPGFEAPAIDHFYVEEADGTPKTKRCLSLTPAAGEEKQHKLMEMWPNANDLGSNPPPGGIGAPVRFPAAGGRAGTGGRPKARSSRSWCLRKIWLRCFDQTSWLQREGNLVFSLPPSAPAFWLLVFGQLPRPPPPAINQLPAPQLPNWNGDLRTTELGR